MSKCACDATFKLWMQCRYSAQTNTLARKLKGVYFGQGNRPKIDRETRAFSLSDSYWLSSGNEEFKFLSPYYNDFWKGEGAYSGGAVPTLYVSGYMSKEWTNCKELHKYGKEVVHEAEVLALVHAAGIPCEDYTLMSDNELCLYNFTSPTVMLEQADMSGRVDPDNFDNDTIIALFGEAGMDMILVDAITANGDRHAGNFGWLRDTATGAYLSMDPLYDFDHAFDSKADSDALTSEAVLTAKRYGYVDRVLLICDRVLQYPGRLNQLFINRTCTIANALLCV